MLSRLSLVNFRNLKNTEVKFSSGLNIFYGNNAQGKTNLLEAIYLLGTGKSFRADTDRELIAWGQTEARIKAQVLPLEVELTVTEKAKKLLVNRQPKKLIELVGEFSVVLFAPEDLLLVTGSPSLRRSWLNSLIARVDRNYLFNIAKLNKIVKSRNRLLFLLSQHRSADLKVWNKAFVEVAAFVWVARKAYLTQINESLKSLSRKLGIDKIYIDYSPQLEISDKATLQQQLEVKLQHIESEEIQRCQTLVGPHRDDFKIIFETIKDKRVLAKDVAVFGSRGEQRTAVLSLKLAEINLIEGVKGQRPTLLLDDVLSEFDADHRAMIQNLMFRQQSVLTTTSLELLNKKLITKASSFYVESGQINQTNVQVGGRELSVLSEE